MPGQVTALYCIVLNSTALHTLTGSLEGGAYITRTAGTGEREAIPLLQSGEK